GEWVPQTCYGQLNEILVCKLPPNNRHNRRVWGRLAGATRLLAVIIPYQTGGKDAAVDIVSHTKPTAPIVADIQSVMAVVGRLQVQGRWYLIDRTGGMVRPEFVPLAVIEGHEDGQVDSN
ncbi:hypothetical protein B0H11DRAFT_1704741, partial [Mycena galericulata]